MKTRLKKLFLSLFVCIAALQAGTAIASEMVVSEERMTIQHPQDRPPFRRVRESSITPKAHTDDEQTIRNFCFRGRPPFKRNIDAGDTRCVVHREAFEVSKGRRPGPPGKTR